MAKSGCVGPLLTIDRGHSTLDCMWHEGATSRRTRLAPDDARGWREFMGGKCPFAAVGLSVVPDGLHQVRSWLAPAPLLEAGTDLPCPLRLAYAQPGQLGVDRWVGAYAAQQTHGDAIVVDCGTAVTVNAVTAAGLFAGGAIGPGAGTWLHGMQARTPRLPLARLTAVPILPATSTQDAVDAGVVLGFCGMVERLVQDLIAACDLHAPTILITGGDAQVLRHARLEAEFCPDLIHQGLRLLWMASKPGC